MSGILSDSSIIEEREKGKIIIEPFNADFLNPCSYDVSLGEYYYRMVSNSEVLCPWSKDSTNKIWGEVNKATAVNACMCKRFELPEGTLGYIIEPDESILTHTNEFIGSIGNITTILQAKSTTGRSGLSICFNSGFGDSGFFSRWTLVIKNNSNNPILLVVGKRIGQIVFLTMTSNPIKDYVEKGRYQKSRDLFETINFWSPELLLPRK